MVLASWEWAWPEKQRRGRCRSDLLTGSRLVCAGRAFSDAWHASQESVVLSDTCFHQGTSPSPAINMAKKGAKKAAAAAPAPKAMKAKKA